MTATEAYAKHASPCRSLLCDVSDLLEAHQARQLDHSDDWGFVGDVARAEEMLRELVEFLRPSDEGGRHG